MGINAHQLSQALRSYCLYKFLNCSLGSSSVVGNMHRLFSVEGNSSRKGLGFYTLVSSKLVFVLQCLKCSLPFGKAKHLSPAL